MILNLPKSRTLRGLIGDEKCFYSAPFVSDTNNDNFVDEVATWETAYNYGNLYATHEDYTTYKVDGLDEFPHPPKRNP